MGEPDKQFRMHLFNTFSTKWQNTFLLKTDQEILQFQIFSDVSKNMLTSAKSNNVIVANKSTSALLLPKNTPPSSLIYKVLDWEVSKGCPSPSPAPPTSCQKACIFHVYNMLMMNIVFFVFMKIILVCMLTLTSLFFFFVCFYHLFIFWVIPGPKGC